MNSCILFLLVFIASSIGSACGLYAYNTITCKYYKCNENHSKRSTTNKNDGIFTPTFSENISQSKLRGAKLLYENNANHETVFNIDDYFEYDDRLDAITKDMLKENCSEIDLSQSINDVLDII